jgi:hypothetical protein
MAEKRSDYSDEDKPKSKEASDPLAELARLIGQNDPFNDIGRPGARKPLDGGHADSRSAPEWLARPAPADDYDQHPAPRDAYRADPRYHQPDDDQHHAAAHDDRYAQGAHEQEAAPDDAPHDSQYDDRYRVARPPAGDYDGDHYYAEDGHLPPHGEDGAAPSRRRGGLMTVAAVLGLAVIGTAGAFGYRAFTATPGGSANPPVIKADTAPAKIVPPAAPPADAQASSKPFQERVGAVSTERILPREEQPVSLPVPPQPRPSAPQTAFAPSGASPLVAPPPSTAGGAFNEPKRVKTQTIRPDTMNDATATAQPPATSAKSAPMAIAPQSDPAPRTKTAARTPAAAAAGGAYVVQVSAQRSEAEAQSSYRALQQKYPALLGAREPSIRRVDLGDKGGIYYRAQVGSFATMEQASTFCSNLKEAGGQCIAQKN